MYVAIAVVCQYKLTTIYFEVNSICPILKWEKLKFMSNVPKVMRLEWRFKPMRFKVSSGEKRGKGIRNSDYRTVSRNFSVQKNKKREIKSF